ncbi:MAG: STAS domain-containing protein [Phycisphaerae bacterium]|nr:STAS domain-containing protein [Phycisphaerae bacterium]
MKIDHQTFGTVEVCTPVGALVDEDAERFVAHLLERSERADLRFVLGMEEVPYMDSVALEGFLSVADTLQSRGVRLKLIGVTSTCREIFEITGLSNRFQFFESVEDAVRSFL